MLDMIRTDLTTIALNPVLRCDSAATLVCVAFGVSKRDIRRKCRYPHLVRARQLAMWLAHQRGATLAATGRYFGRDHTTVLYACRVVEARRADEGFAARAEGLLRLLERRP